ncbi:MAG: nitroreductase [Epulopiscium sp. Nele67-Bin005]|nr:MAG: nitroreductase [Epulopiscium sp. Nele67-Bin005]
MNAIFTRRSVRKFNDTVVEAEKIEKLLRAAMQAPSSKNQQCWEFIVVTKKEDIQKLSKTHTGAKPLETANAVIVVLGNSKRMVMAERWQQDLGAVTQNILLQATELDLGSLWCGIAPDAEREKMVREMYNLDDSLYIYSTIGIGYPHKEDALKFVDRFDENRITYIK